MSEAKKNKTNYVPVVRLQEQKKTISLRIDHGRNQLTKVKFCEIKTLLRQETSSAALEEMLYIHLIVSLTQLL